MPIICIRAIPKSSVVRKTSFIYLLFNGSIQKPNLLSASEHVHAKDGYYSRGAMINIPCSATIKMWTPVNMKINKMVVMFEGQHNHPPFAFSKLTPSGRDAIEEAYAAANDATMTAQKLNRGDYSLSSRIWKSFDKFSPAGSTRVAFGMTLAEKDPALRNKRLV